MASAPWWNLTDCFPLSSWLNACVSILAASMNLIFLFPKRLRDYALCMLKGVLVMSGFLGKAKNITGIGLSQNELYARAFEKGVLLNKFAEAADIFDKAAKKFQENGDQANAAQAG